jgi:hypothetical protein
MRPYHPDDFVPGRKYLLEGRGVPGMKYTFQSLTTIEPPPVKTTLFLVFEAPMDTHAPEDIRVRYVPADKPVMAEEVK